MRYEELTVGGRNAALEVFRPDGAIDKLFALDGCRDGPIHTILREARKYDTIVNYVPRERLDQIPETGKHQGVIVCAAAYEYVEVKDMLKAAEEEGEPPFLVLPGDIEDPRNLGAIICTANLAGAHGVIIPEHRAAGLVTTVVKILAGALNYTPVVKVINLMAVMEDLKKKGIRSICADMGGEFMYKMNLKGSIGLVAGNEGKGVGKLVHEHYDMVASIPMKRDIGSLDVLVAAGVLAYRVVRQRLEMQSFQR